MDSALRENLSAGLADGLDDHILSGTNGLFTGTHLTNNNQTTNDDFDSYLSNLVWNQVDGRYAAMTSDLSMVVGAATYKDLGATYRNTSVDRSALGPHHGTHRRGSGERPCSHSGHQQAKRGNQAWYV